MFNKQIAVRIDEKTLQLFKSKAAKERSDISKQLKGFIENYIKE